MNRDLKCLRCGAAMNHALTENLQLGKTDWLLGDWPNLLAGAMYVAVYCCPKCGKIEFFAAEDPEHTRSDLPQISCPNCGHSHDFDYPACPFCKHRY